ncbi:hypothetical protein ACVIU4_010424 [Bradyrhizobium barranii subsp. barranii]|nr:hypothetical protein [Bradyrhizobium japonicum]MCP1962625.1 hypothetical protein [Bradyrhizobium japonicum]
MVQRVSTVAFEGIEARAVDVQVQVAPGLPAFAIVGLPDKAVSEARERVRSALIASGLALPARRIIVNLAPADLPKEGSHYDLPIAIGANVREEGLICPAACGSEAAWASPDIQIIAAQSLIQIANHFKGTQVLSRPTPRVHEVAASPLDLRDIKGQESAKRALEMRAVLKRLREMGLPADDVLEMSWNTARGRAQGITEDAELEDWREAEAQKLVEAIARAKLGARLTKNPDITAIALAKLNDGLPQALMAQWTEPAEATYAHHHRSHQVQLGRTDPRGAQASPWGTRGGVGAPLSRPVGLRPGRQNAR